LTKLVTILLLFVLTGCGFKDIDKRFFVVAIGIDKGQSHGMKYRVSLKLAIPGDHTQMSSKNKNNELTSQDANSITEAVRLIKSKVDKELDFGHAKIVMIGQDLIQDDIRDTMDWLNRRRDIQLVSWMAVGKPTAEAVLATQTRHERLPGNSLLFSFGKTGVESGFIISEYLFDFFRKEKEWGLDPILPIVEASGNHYTINTSVVFDKNRARLTLTSEETRIFNVIRAYVNKIEYEVPVEGSRIFISASKIKTKYLVHTPQAERPFVDLRIRITGIIEEANLTVSPDKLKLYEQSAEKTGKERVTILLKKLQKENLDPFGFGLDYRAHHFGNLEEEWKTWQSLYPDLEFRVNVNLKLKGTGSLK
jgi:spore germination protein KC